MDFRLNEEQQMLQDTVERLVRGEYSFEKRLAFSETELGFSADFWQQLSELGPVSYTHLTLPTILLV